MCAFSPSDGGLFALYSEGPTPSPRFSLQRVRILSLLVPGTRGTHSLSTRSRMFSQPAEIYSRLLSLQITDSERLFSDILFRFRGRQLCRDFIRCSCARAEEALRREARSRELSEGVVCHFPICYHRFCESTRKANVSRRVSPVPDNLTNPNNST